MISSPGSHHLQRTIDTFIASTRSSTSIIPSSAIVSFSQNKHFPQQSSLIFATESNQLAVSVSKGLFFSLHSFEPNQLIDWKSPASCQSQKRESRHTASSLLKVKRQLAFTKMSTRIDSTSALIKFLLNISIMGHLT